MSTRTSSTPTTSTPLVSSKSLTPLSPPTLQEILDKSMNFLRGLGFESPRLEAELLLCHALKIENRVNLYLRYDQPLTEKELEVCRSLLSRRSRGEPLAYIVGEKYFYRLPFIVTSKVLIPRPETELLVEEILTRITQLLSFSKKKQSEDPLVSPKSSPRTVHIIDLGTGSGCLGLALTHEIQNFANSLPHPSSFPLHPNLTLTLTLVDISAEALEVARQNAERLGLLHLCTFCQTRAETFHWSLLDKEDPSALLVVLANPPYIAPGDPRLDPMVGKFEPSEALFSKDPEGLSEIQSWSLNLASQIQGKKGFFGIEVGQGQADSAHLILEATGIFSSIQRIKDLNGIERHLIGELSTAEQMNIPPPVGIPLYRSIHQD